MADKNVLGENQEDPSCYNVVGQYAVSLRVSLAM